MNLRFALSFALLASGSLAACGDDDDDHHGERPAQCESLATTCHDSADAEAQACHEVGHDGTAAECAAEYDRCIALCAGTGTHDGGATTADGGEHHDDGGHDHAE